MSNLPVARPFGEHDLADELRLDPVCRATEDALRRRLERTPLLFDRIERATQLDGPLVREAGSNLSAEHQPASFVVADQQCAQPRARAFRLGEPADDELLLVDALRLHPVAVA